MKLRAVLFVIGIGVLLGAGDITALSFHELEAQQGRKQISYALFNSETEFLATMQLVHTRLGYPIVGRDSRGVFRPEKQSTNRYTEFIPHPDPANNTGYAVIDTDGGRLPFQRRNIQQLENLGFVFGVPHDANGIPIPSKEN